MSFLLRHLSLTETQAQNDVVGPKNKKNTRTKRAENYMQKTVTIQMHVLDSSSWDI